MARKVSTNDPIVDAIYDLAKVVLLTSGEATSKAETVRKLGEMAIPPPRIAMIMAMEPKDVHSVLSRAKGKKKAKVGTNGDN